MRLVSLITSLVFLASCGVIHASQVMPRPESLARVVARADTIVVVRVSKAKNRAIKVPLRGGGQPFVRQQNPWEVTRVLRGDSTLVGQTIYVDVYDWGFNVAMVETLRQHGPTPSKEVPSYQSLAKKPPEMAEPRILFLRKESDDAYEPAVMDAVESVRFLDQVRAAIGALPPKR